MEYKSLMWVEVSEVSTVLNREAVDGWRPITFGPAWRMQFSVIVFERVIK